jgi:hypothetical protein
MSNITIPLSEEDLEYFKEIVYKGASGTWSFIDDQGNEVVVVTFVQEKENE